MVGFMVSSSATRLLDKTSSSVGTVVVYKYSKDENTITIKLFTNDTKLLEYQSSDIIIISTSSFFPLYQFTWISFTNYKSLMAVTFVTLSNSDAAAPKTPTAAILLPPATAWEYDAITLSKNPPTELTLIWAGFVGGIIWGIKLFWQWSTWAEFVLNNFIFNFLYLTLKNSFNGFTHLCCSFEKRKIPLLVNDFDQYSHIVVGKVIASLNGNFFNCTFAFLDK